MSKSFPVSGYQAQVLRALGMVAKDFDEAKAIFARIGLDVWSERVGRTSEPRIALLSSVGGAFNAYGDGDTWDIDFKAVDLTPILGWVIERDRAAVEARIAKLHATPEHPVDNASIAAAIIADKKAVERARIEERQAQEQRRKEQRGERYERNALLRQHGYHWQKYLVGEDEDSDGYDANGYEWTLYAPDGRVVTVSEALREIASAVRA